MEQKKKGKGANKKKKGGAESSDEEGAGDGNADQEEEKVAPAKKAGKQGTTAAEFSPIDVIYCRVCGIPPEYCMFDKKDSSECKDWLKKTHPDLFQSVYHEEATATPAEGEGEEAKDA